MAILKIPSKALTDNFSLQDYKDDFTALNTHIKSVSFLLDDYASYVSNGDWIPAINQAITDINALGGGTLIFNNVYTVKPSTSNCIVPKSYVTLKSSARGKYGIKVADANTEFPYLIRNTAYMEKFAIDGLLLDTNYANNTNLVSSSNSNNGQYVFTLGAFDTVRITNCVLKASSINMIATTSKSYSLTIKDNEFYWGKQTGAAYYDNSVIYADCLNYEISGNKFYSTDPNANGAVELHWGKGIAINNIVDGFMAGFNLQSADVEATTNSNFIVSNNIIINCVFGVRLWTINSRPLRNVITTNNIIYVNQITRNLTDFYAGISIALDTYNADIENLIINDNVIEFEVETTGRTLTYPQMAGGILLRKYANLLNCVINGNIIENSPVTGISLLGTDTNTYKDVTVKDNQIINAGMNVSVSSAYRSAFFFGSATYIGVIVKDNIITDNNAVIRCLNSFYFLNGTYNYCDIKIDNNIITNKNIGYQPTPTTYDEPMIITDKLQFLKNKDIQVVSAYPPTSGTYKKGDLLYDLATDNLYKCTFSGTYGTLTGVTGSGVQNASEFTVTDATNLRVGDRIYIAGVAYKRITYIIDKTVGVHAGMAAFTNAAVTYQTPNFSLV